MVPLKLVLLGEFLMTIPDITIEPPRLGEPYLLTPGPLTTSYAVKEAMLRDWGSWDDDFRGITLENPYKASGPSWGRQRRI